MKFITIYKNTWRYILFLCSIHVLPVHGVVKKTTPENYSLASPYEATLAHLGFLEPGNYNKKIAAKAFQRGGISDQKAAMVAVKLKEIFEKKLFNNLRIEEITKDPNYIDPIVKYHRYQFSRKLPEVYLVKVKDQWLYSYDTINYVEEQSNKSSIKYLFPKKIRQYELLGICAWQYISLLVLFTLLIVLFILVYYTLNKIEKKLLSKWEIPVSILSRQVSTSLTCLAFKLMIPFIRLPSTIERGILYSLEISFILLLTLLSYRCIDILVFYMQKVVVSHQKNTATVHLLPLLRKILKVLIVIVGFIILLENLEYNTSSLLAGFSIGGLGIAFAAQDTIKNFFGSLMIIIDQPFRVGDDIITDNVEGKIQEIGLRSTRLRTRQGSMMYIPNGKLADIHINNYGLRKIRCFSIEIAISYYTAPPLITSFVGGLQSIATNHPLISTEKRFAYLNNLETTHLSILFSVDLKVNTKKKELECRHDIITRIINLAAQLGISIGNETQLVQLVTNPASPHNTTKVEDGSN